MTEQHWRLSPPSNQPDSRKHRALGRWPSRLAVAITAAAVLLLLSILYARVAGTIVVNSDHASIVLEADAVRHGNVWLRGWTLTNVSFRATDLPFYVAALACGDSEASAMRDVPAVIYALTVLLSVWLAGRGRERSQARLGIGIAFLLVGLPSGLLPQTVLVGVDHIGTTLLMLVALLMLDFAPEDRNGWFRSVLSGVCCLLLMVSDQMAVLTLVLPLFLVTVARCLQARGAARSREGVPLIAIFAALVGAQIFQAAVRRVGGGVIVPLDLFFVSLANLPGNILALAQSLLTLYRADFFGGPVGLESGGMAVDLLALGLVFYTLGQALSAWRGGRRGGDDRVNQVLGLAMVLNLTAYVFNNASTSVVNTLYSAPERYLVPFFFFGAILAGRLGVEVIANQSLLRLGAGLVGVVSVLLFIPQLSLPDAEIPAASLGQWLAARGLQDGYGNFWCSSIVTAETEGQVRVRPIIGRGGALTPLHWFSSGHWYENPAHFVVYDVAQSAVGRFYWGDVNQKTASLTFGPPSEVDRVGPYTVLIWNKNITPALK